MKDYKLGIIHCKCSTRMHCTGHLFKIYETTPEKVRCPNCSKRRKVHYAKRKTPVRRKFNVVTN